MKIYVYCLCSHTYMYAYIYANTRYVLAIQYEPQYICSPDSTIYT